MNKFLLTEGKKKIKQLCKVQNAMYKHDKKEGKAVSKAIKKTIKEKEKEEVMKSNILTTIITVLTVAAASYVFVFQTGTQYQKINNGIETNAKQLSELIELNKNSVKRVTKLERKTDRLEIYTNLHKEEIKNLKK